MKAGDYVYENHDAANRGELEEIVAYCLLAVCEDDSIRSSNGLNVDAMLAALDHIVQTPEQLEAVKVALEEL